MLLTTYIDVEQVFELEWADDLTHGLVDDISSFSPLVPDHVVDSLAHRILHLFETRVHRFQLHIGHSFELFVLGGGELVVLQGFDLLTGELEALFLYILLDVSFITFFGQQLHLLLQTRHVYLHLILREFELGDVVSVFSDLFSDCFGCLIFKVLDLLV